MCRADEYIRADCEADFSESECQGQQGDLNMDNAVTISVSVKAERCPYWDFQNHTRDHDCNSCYCATDGNNIENAKCGIMINGDRYCTIGADIYAEIIKEIT